MNGLKQQNIYFMIVNLLMLFGRICIILVISYVHQFLWIKKGNVVFGIFVKDETHDLASNSYYP